MYPRPQCFICSVLCSGQNYVYSEVVRVDAMEFSPNSEINCTTLQSHRLVVSGAGGFRGHPAEVETGIVNFVMEWRPEQYHSQEKHICNCMTCLLIRHALLSPILFWRRNNTATQDYVRSSPFNLIAIL